MHEAGADAEAFKVADVFGAAPLHGIGHGDTREGTFTNRSQHVNGRGKKLRICNAGTHIALETFAELSAINTPRSRMVIV